MLVSTLSNYYLNIFQLFSWSFPDIVLLSNKSPDVLCEDRQLELLINSTLTYSK